MSKRYPHATIGNYRVEDRGQELLLGPMGLPSAYLLSRQQAADLRDWIDGWLAHDPDKELREKIANIRSRTLINDNDWYPHSANQEIIDAVRAHDAQQ